MISLSDSLLATGATLTFHYTHPSRDVAMQIALAMRLDFTEPSPQNLMRASVFFTGYVSNGQPVNLLSSGRAQPQFRASAVSEVLGELIADNCELSAVVSQFDQSGGGGAGLVAVSVLKIVFARTAGGPPMYTHIVKTWPGGRSRHRTGGEGDRARQRGAVLRLTCRRLMWRLLRGRSRVSRLALPCSEKATIDVQAGLTRLSEASEGPRDPNCRGRLR